MSISIIEVKQDPHNGCVTNPCSECLANIESAIVDQKFAYARARRYWSCYQDWQVIIYHRDSNSPTGMVSASGGMDKIVAPLLARHGKTSPLSPSELA